MAISALQCVTNILADSTLRPKDVAEITKQLQRVHGHIAAGLSLSESDLSCLKSCGLIIYRRRRILACSSTAEEDETTALQPLEVCIFLMLALVARSRTTHAIAHESLDHASLIEQWRIQPVTPVSAVAAPESTAADCEVSGEYSGAHLVCDAALRAALVELEATNTYAEITKLSDVYYRETMRQSGAHLLSTATTCDGEIIGLAAAPALRSPIPEPERLRAVVAAAESEAGQAALRDIFVSLAAARGQIMPRRKVTLSREEAQALALQAPDLIAQAHVTAMRGALDTWDESDDPMARASSLLAGLEMLSRSEKCCTDDAFRGRVALDFFLTEPPKERALRLSHVDDAWYAFRVRSRGGIALAYRGVGFLGLCRAVLVVANDISSSA